MPHRSRPRELLENAGMAARRLAHHLAEGAGKRLTGMLGALRRKAASQAPVRARLGRLSHTGRGVSSCLVNLDGLPGELQYYTGGAYVPETRVILAWNRPEAFRVIAGTAVLVDRRSFPLAGWLYTGNPEFDEAFVVQARPAEFVRELLDYDTRQRLLDLADLAGDLEERYRARIETYPVGSGFSNLVLGVHGSLERARDSQAAFLTHALAMARRLWIERAESLPIVAHVEDGSRGQCPVCGEELGGPLARCEACRTLHHGECWSYNDGCATYACPSRRRPPLPPPAEAGSDVRTADPVRWIVPSDPRS